jgi:predicted nucleic acid-binding protein
VSYLLDTDICSAHLKSHGAVSSRVLQNLSKLHVSVITAGELRTWAYRRHVSRRRAVDLEYFLKDVEVLPVTIDIANRFGELRANLLDQGQATPELDLLIAATALVHDLTLVTHNTKDFERIPDLSIVDWMP